MEISLYIAGLLALLVTLLTGIVLRPLANKLDIVAHPNERTVHSGDIPLVGGLAIFIGFCTAVTFIDSTFFLHQPFFLACLILITLGLLDDRSPLSVRARFMFQIIAVLIVVFWAEISLTNLGDILFVGELKLGIFAIPFMVFATVGVINALNMADGIDGLASGYTVIALSGLLYLAWGCENCANEQILLLLLIAAVLGFMLLNARSPWCRKAQVFMGDSGSMFLGFALAVTFIQLSQGDTKIMTPVTALWLFALPLMDTVSIIVRRKKQGQSPFSPGKDHIHHILQRAGYKVEEISLLGWGTSIGLALIGIMGYRLGVHEGIMFTSFIALFFFYHWMVSRALRKNQIVEQQLQPSPGTSSLLVQNPTIEYMFMQNQDSERVGNKIIINDHGMRKLHADAQEIETRISDSGDSAINSGNVTANDKLATLTLQQGQNESNSGNYLAGNVSANIWDIVNLLADLKESGYLDTDYVLFMFKSGDYFCCPTFTGLDQKTHPIENPISAYPKGVVVYLTGYTHSFDEVDKDEADKKVTNFKDINAYEITPSNAFDEQFSYMKRDVTNVTVFHLPDIDEVKNEEQKDRFSTMKDMALQHVFDIVLEKSYLSSNEILLQKQYRDEIHMNNIDQ